MAKEAIAKRYAQAAFELAIEEGGDLTSWTEALSRIAHFLSDGEAARALQNSRMPEEAKHRLINAGLGDLPRLPLNLAHLLVAKDRTSLAAEVANQFVRLVEEHQGLARAKAITAIELSEVDLSSLRQRLQERTGRQVLLENEVDPSILGGLVLQIGDRLIDGSTRSRLETLRESLVGAVR